MDTIRIGFEKDTECVGECKRYVLYLSFMDWRLKLKELMRQRKVTQEDLIDAFGVTTRGAVGHYLSGRREPTVEMVARAAKRLDVTVSDLVGDARPAMKAAQAQEPLAIHVHAGSGGVLDSAAREKIGERLFSEIKRTGRKPSDVAARLRMSPGEFSDRARHGDLSLEDLAEIVLFLGQGAALDYIVLGRFPTADSLGPAGEIIAEIRRRALTGQPNEPR